MNVVLPLILCFPPWHGQMGFAFSGFFSFVLSSVGLAWVMTWVHLNTQGSILAALLMHFYNNFTGTALMPHSDQAEIIHMIVLIGLSLTLCLWMERKTWQQAAVARG